jgi:sentrin-specific protease 1
VILIPINHNQTHWSAAVINFKRKRVEAYDSLNPTNSRGGIIFDKLREYIREEHRDKKGKDFDFTGWANYGRPVNNL